MKGLSSTIYDHINGFTMLLLQCVRIICDPVARYASTNFSDMRKNVYKTYIF